MKKRVLEIWEINFLRKHGFNPENISLKKNQPIEYFIGKCEFVNLELDIESPILIPRIETEKIIDLSLDKIKKNKNKKLQIAEIGCGSLAISLGLATQLNKEKISYSLIAGDISQKAISLSQKNLKKYQKPKIKIIFSDLLANFPEKKFDLILANLPYIPSSRIKNLDQSVINYESICALNGGENGLKLINQLLEQIPKYLTKYGNFILEIDETHSLKDFKEFAKIYHLEIIKDCFDKNRFLVGSFI
jgi:release factor glutamine methyltransferase